MTNIADSQNKPQIDRTYNKELSQQIFLTLTNACMVVIPFQEVAVHINDILTLLFKDIYTCITVEKLMVRIYKKICPNIFILTVQIFVHVDVKIDAVIIV